MKHLKRFNESSIDDIINDCKDILIDLSDNNITYKVWVSGRFSGSGSIIVDIGDDDDNSISLMNMSDTFEHLISYLESFGYLFSKKSFYHEDLYYGSPLDKAELFHSIKNGVKFYFMRIQFEKSKITIK